jgi:hypothetical protein
VAEPALDRWLFREYAIPAEGLAVSRMLYAASVLLIGLPRWWWVPDLAPSFYRPPLGLASLAAAPPPTWVFHALNLAAVSACVCLFVGLRTRVSSIAIAVVLWIGNSFGYAFGKIDHDVLLLLVPLAGAAAGWGTALSVDGRTTGGERSAPVQAWPLALLAAAIALGMLYASLAKVRGGWLDTEMVAVRSTLAFQRVAVGRATFASAAALRVDWPRAWECADWATVLLEAAFVPAVLRLRWFRAACAIACIFHLANAALLYIQFYPNLLAYAMFVNWAAHGVRGGALAAMGTTIGRVRSAAVALVALAVWSVYATVGNPLAVLAEALGQAPEWALPWPLTLGATGIACVWLAGASGWFVTRRRVHEVLAADPDAGRLAASGRPVILFDGFCGLCNGWVDFVLRRDVQGR